MAAGERCDILVEVSTQALKSKATLDGARAARGEQQKPTLRSVCELPFLE